MKSKLNFTAGFIFSCFVLLLSTATQTWAQATGINYLRSVDASSAGGTVTVKIELTTPLAGKPSGFTVLTPPRVAIDLPNVRLSGNQGQVQVGKHGIRSFSLSETGGSTRMVLNMDRSQVFTVRTQNNYVYVTLDDGGSSTAFDVEDTVNSISDIDFRRTADGGGRIVVTMSNARTEANITQEGKALAIEFLSSSLPERLRRKLDVVDFGTPVQNVTAQQSGQNVKIRVESRGNWEHSATQKDRLFTLDVRPITIDPHKLTQGVGYTGEKLSLNFQNIDMRALLQVIADFTNFNIITSETVGGSLTLRLKDVPWDQGLDIIMQAKGLAARKTGNVIWIAPQDEILTKERKEYEAREQLANLEPVRSQNFQLNYVHAQDVANALIGSQLGGDKDRGRSILSGRGTIIIEPRTNQMFITDIPTKLEEVALLLSKIDIPVRQVQIEARIVEASESFSRNLGFIWGYNPGLWNRQPSVGNSQLGIVGGGTGNISQAWNGTYSSAGTTSNAATTYLNNFANLPAGTSTFDATFALFSAASGRTLALEIQAAEAEGRVKTVASPRLITSDQKQASIEQGVQIPYQQATSSGATSVTFKSATLKLSVTPQITPEGNVILDVDVNKDSLAQSSSAAGQGINTKHIATQVLVENGGTVVIGGIYEQSIDDSISKVPVLGDLPLIGRLFRSTSKVASRNETMVFITPRIVSERAIVR